MDATPRFRGSAIAALITGISAISATPSVAHPVDCAILLCLAGGWPAHPTCAHAKAVFMRRATPWPIEPPLQVWRCPMGAAASSAGDAPWSTPVRAAHGDPLVASDDMVVPASFDPRAWAENTLAAEGIDLPQVEANASLPPEVLAIVRGITVHHIRYSQRVRGPEDDEECVRDDDTEVGRYGPLGGFAWSEGTASSAPSPGFDPPGNCRRYRYRAVGVTWTDHAGNRGHEEVRY